MITVHHLNQSRSYRILWLLEELSLPYEVVYYQREKSMLAPPSLKRIHPLGKSPVITDGELVLAESGAIIDYLTVRYDGDHRFNPADPASGEGVGYRYWLHYAEGSLMPLLTMKLIFSMLGKAPVPLLARPLGAALGAGFQKQYLNPQLSAHRQYLENHLGHSRWFAGDRFSAADIQMSFPLEILASRFGADGFPHIQAFLDTIQSRPAYLRAKAREKNH